MKKMIALILIFAMLAPLSSAVAADELSAKPTVEEILDEYHRRAFELETQGDAARTRSTRSGTSKTLEQETVDTLTAAGYEAYNVTADNYGALEAELCTDFGALGMDPDGSYIIVIGGVDDGSSGNANSRARPEIDIVGPPDHESGGSSFEYTQDGATYTMRYVTVTGDVGSNMGVISALVVEADDFLIDLSMDFLDAYLITAVDTLARIPIGTLLSIWFGASTPDNYFVSDVGVMTITGASIWTVQSIQIWDSDDQQWKTAQSSGSVRSQARCKAEYIDYSTGDVGEYEGEWCYSEVRFAPLYTNTAQRLRDAVLAYSLYSISYDRTGDVNFYLGKADGEIIYNAEGNVEPLFTHDEWWSVPAQGT